MKRALVTGKYNGTQFSTIENISNQDWTSSWNGKFIQMTARGDMIVSVGGGTANPSTSKGIVKIRGEAEMWTQSLKLTNLNGAKWTCEGESNFRKGKSIIYVDIH